MGLFATLCLTVLSAIMLIVAIFYCYREFHYAECRYVERHYAECRYTECLYAERCYAECHYAECCYFDILYGAALLVK